MDKSQMSALLKEYRRIIDAMQERTFYCEDAEGVLRRWVPPKRPIVDMEGDTRPANCRERLIAEGKSYPRSNCSACGSLLRAGWECPHKRREGEG